MKTITFPPAIRKGMENLSIIRYTSQINLSLTVKRAGLVLLLIGITNGFSYFFGQFKKAPKEDERLYMLDKASAFVSDLPAFEQKVREVSADLGVPAEWLMAVMYQESRFDTRALNLKGSGATGLIQFMPLTAKDMGTSVNYLKDLGHTDQLEYVKDYLERSRRKYGEFKSLTDLYLAILYPKARDQETCYSLFAAPSVQYKQNAGLDEDKDGRVTIMDVDRRMKRLYTKAYMTEKEN